MPAPNASYSVRLRAEIEHHPGALGRLTTAIGEAGGNLSGLDIVEATGDTIVRDITIFAVDEAHVERIRKAVQAVENVRILDISDRTFLMHAGGKIEVRSKVALATRDDLSMAYTPGVARVCMSIAERPDEVHKLTIKRNSVAIVTDGTAVLGLGDIGPYAALPVMEGKAMLFKEFADVDAFPVCLKADSADDVIDAVQRLEPVFGGINLEDIAAPRCFEVEERLQEMLDIPVFHDDQHGTAVVALAALRNALKVVEKRMEDLYVVIAGAGAAGVAIAKILLGAGVPNIVALDSQGAIHRGRTDLDTSKRWLAEHTNADDKQGELTSVMAGCDVFIGVSGRGVLTRDDLKLMNPSPIVFALSNPTPEINPEEAEGLVAVMATGRSDYANQINNVLCFPGIFRGALDAGATRVSEGMKLAAADAIAAGVSDEQLTATYVIPSVFNRNIGHMVARAVAEAAVADGVTRSAR